MGQITVNSLVTSVQANSSFGVWLGTPLTSNLTGTDTFSGYVVKGVSTPLVVSNRFTGSVNASRTLTTTLKESSTFSASKINLSFFNTAIPAITAIPDPVPQITLPHSFADSGNRPPLTFTFTYAGVTLLVLNAPDFGDSENLHMVQDKKYSRGNTLIITHVEAWGNEKTYEYNFSYLNRDQRYVLLQILRNFLGIKIGITDHLGIFRLGFILTPEADIFEPVPHGYSATFRFQEIED